MEVGTPASPVGHDSALHLAQQRTEQRIVIASDDCAVEGHAIHEVQESALHVAHVAVTIHVFAIDVGNHRDDGRELEE